MLDFKGTVRSIITMQPWDGMLLYNSYTWEKPVQNAELNTVDTA